MFKGDEQKFVECARKTEDYLVGVEPKFNEMLEWSLEQDKEFTLSDVVNKFGENAENS